MNCGRRRCRSSATLLCAVAAALAAGCSSRPGPVDRILLVTFDTTRADRIGCYGYAAAATPAFDAVAREGVLFENAVSPVPTTLASHATMFTGLYPQDHGVRYNFLYKLGPTTVTLAETLSRAGFATGGFPAAHVVAERYGLRRGFEHWIEPPAADHPRGRLGDAAQHPMRPAAEGVDQALEWIGKTAGRRFFVWLHFYDPHFPYEPPFPWSSQYRDRPYDGEIAYADAQLARLLERLRADPAWERTAVVLAADHGEGLYDHRERYHSTLLYETTQRVPLVIRAPGVAPRRVRAPMTLADLMPTVLDLAGLEPPEGLRGESLVPALTGDDPPEREIYLESMTGAIAYGWAELTGLRDGRWKLIDSADPELYDLAADPGETTNLAPGDAPRVEAMRAALDEIDDPLPGATGANAAAPLDAQALSAIASLGYVAGQTSRTQKPDAPHPRDLVDLEAELLAIQGAAAQGQHREVIEAARYVLTRDPQNLLALDSLAAALLAEGRTSEALPVAQALVAANPQAERAHALLGSAYRALGRVSQALEAVAAGRERLPDSEELAYLWVVAAFDAKATEACGDRAREVFSRFPQSGRFAVAEGRCRAARGDVPGAVESLRRAVDLGFRDLDLVRKAPEFSSVVRTDGFRELERRAATVPSSVAPAPNAENAAANL